MINLYKTSPVCYANYAKPKISFRSSQFKEPEIKNGTNILKSRCDYTERNRPLLKIANLHRTNLNIYEIKENKLKVLDIGSGFDGVFVEALVKQGIQAWGIDLKINKKSGSKPYLIEADAQDMSFIGSESLDRIFSTWSMFSYPKEDIKIKINVLKEIYRILKPDGIFSCSPVDKNEINEVIKEAGLEKKLILGTKPIELAPTRFCIQFIKKI